MSAHPVFESKVAAETASTRSLVPQTTRELFKDPVAGLVQQRDVDRVQQLAADIEADVRAIVSKVDFDSNTKFEPSCLLVLLPTMMRTVETYKELPGPQKKAMVLTALKAALAAVVPAPFQAVVLPLVDPVVGAAIDFGVAAYHSLQEEATQANASKCVKFCFGRKQ
jgi:hypothetical protein